MNISHFCVRCGKKADTLYKGFCIPCYIDTHLQLSIRPLKFKRCSRCGRINIRGKWMYADWPHLRPEVISAIETNLYDYATEFDLEGDQLRVVVKGRLDDQGIISVERVLPVQIEYIKTICPPCLRRSGRKWEVKIQLRHHKVSDLKLYTTIKNLIHRTIADLAERDPRAEAFWTEATRDGDDFFFGYKPIGDAVYKKILSAYPKVSHISSGQFCGYTREGKRKVRFTYCVRV